MSTIATQAPNNSHKPDSPEARERIVESTAALKEDLRSVKEDAAEFVSAAGSCLSDESARALEVAKAGGEKAQQLHSVVCKSVAKHPTTAVIASVGLGILIGRLVSGR